MTSILDRKQLFYCGAYVTVVLQDSFIGWTNNHRKAVIKTVLKKLSAQND